MLDLAADVGRYSRLACQIFVDEEMESLTVKIPGAVHNMQGRQ
jgi:ferredoxin